MLLSFQKFTSNLSRLTKRWSGTTLEPTRSFKLFQLENNNTRDGQVKLNSNVGNQTASCFFNLRLLLAIP